MDLAARRAREAIAKKDKAEADFDAVMARCRGAAAEARRRGLGNIAEVLQPPPAAERTSLRSSRMATPSSPRKSPTLYTSEPANTTGSTFLPTSEGEITMGASVSSSGWR